MLRVAANPLLGLYIQVVVQVPQVSWTYIFFLHIPISVYYSYKFYIILITETYKCR